MIPILYGICLILLSLYSYTLIDLNLTLLNTSWWLSLREPFIQIGYFHRDTSWYIYLGLIIALFCLNYFFVKNEKKYNPMLIAGITGGILLFSYPFLSHDFFNYIFDAKILTYYGQNPYLHKALDYPQDEWVRFMHWTHRSYPYGPSFLIFTLIPSYLAMGKFILNYFFFKLLFIFFYLLGVYYLAKTNKKSAIEFATHPVILIEGIVCAHNDLIGVSLAIAGLYFVMKNSQMKGRTLLFLSAMIKYITIPLLFVDAKRESKTNLFAVMVQVVGVLYICITRDVQQWYVLSFFALMPLYFDIVRKFNILLFGLLLSYYPYIRYGGWDTDDKVFLKRAIILGALFLNLLVLAYQHYRAKK